MDMKDAAKRSRHSLTCFQNAMVSAGENGAKDYDQEIVWASQYLEDGTSDCTRDCPVNGDKSKDHWYTR